jgi:hypothetical protein
MSGEGGRESYHMLSMHMRPFPLRALCVQRGSNTRTDICIRTRAHTHKHIALTHTHKHTHTHILCKKMLEKHLNEAHLQCMLLLEHVDKRDRERALRGSSQLPTLLDFSQSHLLRWAVLHSFWPGRTAFR